MRNYSFFSILVVTFVSLAAAAHGHGINKNTQVPHLIYGDAQPRNARIQDAVYEIRIHVGKQPLTQLSIQVPEGVEVTKGINALNLSNQKLDVYVHSSGAKLIISFAQPVSSGETLNIRMKGIRTGRYPNIWLFPISVNIKGINAELPLGAVRIATQI